MHHIIYPVIAAFGVTVATGIGSAITDGRILNWTNILTRSTPIVVTEYQEVQDLGSDGLPFSCSNPKSQIYSCFAGTMPSGGDFCGWQIETKDDGTSVCKVYGCGSHGGNLELKWGIWLSCAAG